MWQYNQIKFSNISQFIMIFIVWLGYQSPAQGQVRFDYIADWSNIFLSNINLISTKTNPANDKLYGSSIENLSFISTLTFNDFYREHLGNLNRNFSSFQQINTLQTSLRLNNQIFVFGAEYGISQKEINYDLTESQSFHVRNGYKEYRFFLATSLLKDYLHLRGGLGRKILDRIEFYPWNFGVTFQPAKSISLTYQRFEDFFRWEYHFCSENPEVLLLADEYSQLDEFQMQIKLISELTIAATMQNNYINKDRTADVPGTILIPIGTHYQRNIMINFFPENDLNVNLHYYNRNHNIFGYFFDSFQKFGKLTEQKDHSDLYQSEFVYRTNSHAFGMSFGWAKGMMSNNGHVESWPFTPTWIDLLGVRYNFRSRLSYDLFRIGASYRYVTSNWQIYFDTSFERINPGGEAKTWEPEVLVFGVQNLNVHTLSTKPRDGIYLGLHLGKSFGNLFQIAYEFHQYVPLEFEITSGSNKNSGMEEKDELLDRSIYGGGKHKLYLILTL
jgi:hypothetical protein